MKPAIITMVIAMALLAALCGIVSGAKVTSSITYQGKLTDAAGNPLTGTYAVNFTIYESSIGGDFLFTDTHSVTVTNGLFTTTIWIPFPSLLNGQALWLGITVGSDPEMTPRQEIRPVPYALSLRPGAWIMSTDQAALNLANIGGGNVLNIVSTQGASHGIIITTYQKGSFGIYATMEGADSPGLYTRTNGTHSDGVLAFTNNANSNGFRTMTTGQNSYGVRINTSGPGSHGLFATTFGDTSDGFSARTNGQYSDGIDVFTSGYESTGVNVTTTGLISEGIETTTTGNWSNGLSSNAWGSRSDAVYAGAHGSTSRGVNAYSSSYYGIYAETGAGNDKYGIYTPDYLYAKGTQVPAADVAEYMPVTGDAPPGTVLVISENKLLRPSDAAYDPRVAGIVSTDPGVSLGTKEGGNPGEVPVAIAGRVPCRVDAGVAPIHAGDLLTTSGTPGHAMRAEPMLINGRGFYPDGTILGKAMESLESGTGMIEVMVTLQ